MGVESKTKQDFSDVSTQEIDVHLFQIEEARRVLDEKRNILLEAKRKVDPLRKEYRKVTEEMQRYSQEIDEYMSRIKSADSEAEKYVQRTKEVEHDLAKIPRSTEEVKMYLKSQTQQKLITLKKEFEQKVADIKAELAEKYQLEDEQAKAKEEGLTQDLDKIRARYEEATKKAATAKEILEKITAEYEQQKERSSDLENKIRTISAEIETHARAAESILNPENGYVPEQVQKDDETDIPTEIATQANHEENSDDVIQEQQISIEVDNSDEADDAEPQVPVESTEVKPKVRANTEDIEALLASIETDKTVQKKPAEAAVTVAVPAYDTIEERKTAKTVPFNALFTPDTKIVEDRLFTKAEITYDGVTLAYVNGEKMLSTIYDIVSDKIWNIANESCMEEDVAPDALTKKDIELISKRSDTFKTAVEDLYSLVGTLLNSYNPSVDEAVISYYKGERDYVDDVKFDERRRAIFGSAALKDSLYVKILPAIIEKEQVAQLFEGNLPENPEPSFLDKINPYKIGEDIHDLLNRGVGQCEYTPDAVKPSEALKYIIEKKKEDKEQS